MLGKFFLGGESSSIDPLKLFLGGVPPMIGTCDMQEFESLNFLGVRDMTACTKITKFSIAVKRDGFSFRNIIQPA